MYVQIDIGSIEPRSYIVAKSSEPSTTNETTGASTKDRRRAKAQRRSGRFGTGTDLFTEIRQDREAAQLEDDRDLVHEAMTSLCVTDVEQGGLVEQGILYWMDSWLSHRPGRTRICGTFTDAKERLGFKSLRFWQRRQVLEGMCRARQAVEPLVRERQRAKRLELQSA